ncbi:DUF6054 family protein [Candidatus Stoquefichus massiliensis]|uniref:DUF6054 family protein n=1 Tax=Candidatus Stoquefichus massiliensis TaxID=1470350 RepID=UPI0004B65FB6|nr:DUF6054 family protein [Candidatus Stoquefichus massiliensis]
MAKYVKEIAGDYDHFIAYIDHKMMNSSISVDIEDKHKTRVNNVMCTILVYERYSYSGGNRVSMNITILGYQKSIQVVAITSGGSTGTFFKINTIGEENFLNKFIEIIEEYRGDENVKISKNNRG